MRDAFGGTFMMYIIIIFIVLYVTFLAFAMKYTLSYRVKNQIINYIEQYEGFNTIVKDKLESEKGYLDQMGYKEPNVVSGSSNSNIPKNQGETYCSKDYGYCVTMQYYDGKQAYYKVTTYIIFQFPVKVLDLNLEIPITGETRLVTAEGIS